MDDWLLLNAVIGFAFLCMIIAGFLRAGEMHKVLKAL